MSLEKGYVRIILLMLLFAVAISIYKTYRSYNLYQQKKEISYHSTATILDNHINNAFSYVDSIANILAQEISVLENPNPKNIAPILLQYKKVINNNNFLFWTVFSFVDKNFTAVATSKDGVLKKGKKFLAKDRQWVDIIKENSWRRHLSNMDYGLISGQYIIPYAYGFTDKNNNYLGAITMGIGVNDLNSRLVEILGDSKVRFLVFRKDKVDNKLELILKNINNDLIINNSIITNYINNYKKDFKFDFNNIRFSHLHNDKKSDFLIVIGQNKNLLDNEFKAYIYPGIEQSIILILFLTIIYIILKRKVVNPIANLSLLSKRIAEGEKTVIIPRYQCIEIDYLAKQIKTIKGYIGLEEKKEKAEKENILKTSFLSSVSHEIRNPISAIYSIGEILESKEGYESLSEENKQYFLKEIKNQATESLNFIEDLLDVGQAESGNFQLGKLKEENIADLVLKSVKISRGLAIRSEITINFNAQDNLPLIKCDKRRIKQIFVNLLNNSIKYSHKNAKISINIKKLGTKRVRVILQDQGFGMTKNDIKKALSKQKITNKLLDSFGIGLPIINHLIIQHKGSLQIESKIDQGSKFTIDF